MMYSKTRCSKIISFIFIVLSIIAQENAHAESFMNFETKLKHDDNLTNAKFSSDIVGDSLVSAVVNAGYYWQLSDYNSLRAQADLAAEVYNTYHGLNNVSLGGTVFLKHKWGLGLYEPWTAVSLSAARLQYNQDVRDGWQYQAQISAGKRISEHWDLWADLALQKRTADKTTEVDPGVSGAAFDTFNTALKLDAIYAFDDKTFLTLGYQLRHGDVVSTTIQEAPSGTWDGIVKAVALDPTFGADAEAYTINGATQTFGVSINTAITTNVQLGLEYQRYITHGSGGINYYKSMPAVSFSYGF